MYFMPVAKRLCFIDLDDWFKTYFIPIAGIIFVGFRARGPLFERTIVVDNDHGDDLLCEATARELVYEERKSQRSDCVSRNGVDMSERETRHAELS